ncbi:MAG: hypothetical protein OXF99_01325 [bacterium]|nr:hypothetical protein [bacterium]
MASDDEYFREVVVRLNQQQLELVDDCVDETDSGDREELLLRALREFHKEHSS